MKKHRLSGLDKDIWLPDNIQVIVDIVPSWRTNIRSNQKFTGQKYTTWHDTGNPNSNALGERNWLHSGAGGAYVGYNFAVDANRIIQLVPLDEVTWHAGTAEGNKYSWGMEQCLNTDWNATFRTCAALQGALCAAMGWNVDVALVQHNKWYGKHCPAQIRNRGLWPQAVALAKQFAAEARAAAGSGGSPTTPTPSVPSHGIPGFDGTKDVTLNGSVYHADKKSITLTATTNVRRWASTDADIIRLADAGKIDVLGWVEGEDVDGVNKWWIVTDGRLWAGTTEEEPTPDVTDPEESQKLVTGKNIYDGAVYYSAGSIETGRAVKVALAGKAYKTANTTSPVVQELAVGDEFVARLWCFGETVNGENTWWLAGTGSEKNPFEECMRIPAAYTTERPE